MAGKSNYLENGLLNHVFRGVAFPTLGASVYLALFTTLPGEDGSGGVEVSGGSYARQAVTRATGQFKDPATGTQGLTENINTITFPTATADWGTVVGAAWMDAPSAGNMLYFNSLAVSKTVNTGDVLKFNAGDAEITED